jgi:plexin A
LNKYRESAYRIGFQMDNVEMVRDLEKYFENIPSLLTYVEDPKVFQFPNHIKLYKGDTLVIEVG